MRLCNDNFWGYTSELIYKLKVRWLEAAIVQPCWANMMCYYIEEDYGHLLDEVVGQQRARTVVRGSCCSFQMPWEEILFSLEKKTAWTRRS